MNAKPLIFAGLGYFAYKAVQKGYAASRLNYLIDKITFKIDGAYILVFVHIAIQNASNATLQIKSFSGTMYVNDRDMGNISSFTITNINPNSQNIFVITTRISMVGAGLELFNLLNSGFQITVQVDGTINVNGVPIPISVTRKML